MPTEESAPRKEQTCPNCKATVDRLAVQCPECDAPLPMLGGYRRSSRGRRYVYGKRKAHLSQEAVWLIVVITVGLLIVFGVQVLAFMRSKKILLVPPQSRAAICCLQPSQRPPKLSSSPRGDATRPLVASDERQAARPPLRLRAVPSAAYRCKPYPECPGRQVLT